MVGIHALDRMQERGLMPSVIEEAIKHGEAVPSKNPGTVAYWDFKNNITVVANSSDGKIVTVSGGIINQ